MRRVASAIAGSLSGQPDRSELRRWFVHTDANMFAARPVGLTSDSKNPGSSDGPQEQRAIDLARQKTTRLTEPFFHRRKIQMVGPD